VAIDYRYHIGSLVSIFVALLLGILIGIGLAPRPEELNNVVSNLRKEYQATRIENREKLERLQRQANENEAVAKEAVSAVIAGRLSGKRVALLLNHNLGHGLADRLRATLAQAGASVTSSTTITSEFVTMPQQVQEAVCRRLLLYPPPGTKVRPLLARAIARDLCQGQSKLIGDLHADRLLQSTPGSSYDARVDAVLIVGGMKDAAEASPEQIDVPLIKELAQRGVRVVGCEESGVLVSCIPAYKSQGIPTVDNIDTVAGRLALVLALEGVDGHFGVKETADRLLPQISAAGR
jgi:hypothetical protein